MPSTLPLQPGILEHLAEDVAMRRLLHSQPELGLEEFQTSDRVAEQLARLGYEVHRGLAGTGLVARLRRGSGARSLGLRADMDALPMQEATGLPYASQHPGRMHACGHDGHTAALLAAARHLAGHGCFSGTLNLIFQPAEEGLGGARRMIEDGLFQRFPCDAVFALHNMPGDPAGRFGVLPGRFMASSDTVAITVRGRGGHGSAPHLCVDAAVAAAHIVVALQTVVARNVDPRQMAVVSVGSLHAGSVANVIAETAQLQLTVRAYAAEVRTALRERIISLVQGQARTLGAEVDIDYQWRYPALCNDPTMAAFAAKVVADAFGEQALIQDLQPLTGSEDFSFMLEARPGCYLVIGAGDEPERSGLHSPGYDFNDEILPVAASYWVHLAEAFLVN